MSPGVDLSRGQDLHDALRRFFERECTDERAIAAESDGLDATLWDRAESLGLPLVGLAEERGGSGGTLRDLATLLHLAGRHAAPLPLAETSLAAWLVARAGIEPGSGPSTVVLPSASGTLRLERGRLHGTARAVPWARDASHVVCLVPDGDGSLHVSRVRRDDLTVKPGADLAGMPSDSVIARGAASEVAPWPSTGEVAVTRGGLLRAAQMAGALEALVDITRGYVNERHQFGQPIGRFQSVQQHLVTLAQAAALTAAAAQQAALAGVATGDGDPGLAARAAKLVANQEAARGIRAAHQAHGAIGMTREYRLQLFTRRLQTWRGELGGDQALSRSLGAAVTTYGSVLAVIDRGSAPPEA